MKLKIFFVVTILLTSFYTATAHEFLIKSDKDNVVKEEKITIDVVETHVFIKPEELPVLKDVLLSFIQGKKSSETIKLESISKENLLRGIIDPTTSEDIVVFAKRLPQYWSETTEGILEGDREILEAQGKKVLSVGSYEKYALLFIPGKDSKAISNYVVPGEHPPLFLAPMFNPYSVKVGQKIKFMVTNEGKPVANASISATYDGFSDKENVYAITTKTCKKGLVQISPDSPGLWLITTEVKDKLVDSIADEKSIHSTTLFWVTP